MLWGVLWEELSKTFSDDPEHTGNYKDNVEVRYHVSSISSNPGKFDY